MNRRQFLVHSTGTAAAALLPAGGSGQTVLPPSSQKKVAAIVTTYHRYSHADNIVTKFMEGYATLHGGG